MPWSVHFIGRPDAIRRALDAYANNLDEASRADFNRAHNILEDLVGLNAGDEVLSLNASGGGNGGKQAGQAVTVVMMRSTATHVQ